MSADSACSDEPTCGSVVRCESVSDKSVMESVVDFIHDVVPQAYSGTIKSDEKRDKVLWVSFEYCNITDLSDEQKNSQQNGNVLPILLVLGYSNGIQLWAVMGNGEAQEIISLRQGAIKILRVLPDPQSDDIFSDKRPMVITSDYFNISQQCSAIRFRSLKSGEQVHTIKLKYPVCDIQCNRSSIVVTFKEKITVFDACTLQDRFSINTCYPSSGSIINPIAVGSQWLAFADRTLMSFHQTCGGMAVNGVQSYTATVIHAAKTITKGLTMFGETVASSITGTAKPNPPSSPSMVPSSSSSGPAKVKPLTGAMNKLQPGIVTIVDTKAVPSGELHINNDWKGEGLIAHFPAHDQQPIMCMKFDPSGTLLLTADKLGHDFHVFRILAHPGGSMLGAVHHLYTLHRGDTTSKVQNIAFTLDSRWVAVTTLRGTTHIFPLTPYGGSIGVRTHTSAKVVNRLSRFQRSAGLDDNIQSSVSHRNNPGGGRNSPVLSSSPGSSGTRSHDSHPSMLTRHTAAGRMGNPRLPPYPQPTVLNPLAQIKQPLLLFPGMPASSGSSSPNLSDGRRPSLTGSSSLNMDNFVTVAAIFSTARGWVVSSPSLSGDKDEKRSVDSLYIIGSHGTLIEYVLNPRPATGLTKVTDDSPIEVDVQARAQWPLCRETISSEIKPPLPSSSPLLSTRKPVRNPTFISSRESASDLSEKSKDEIKRGEQWLSQVEMITHTGPHRRLWMGPQFQFMTCQPQVYTTLVSSTSSALLSQSSESPTSSDITEELDLQSLNLRPARSNPVAMPGHGGGSSLPVFIEAASGSFEQSPSILEACSEVSGENFSSWPEGYPPGQSLRYTDPILEHQLQENLAEAMVDFPSKDLTHAGSTGISSSSSICRASSGEFQASSDDLSTPSSHSGSVSQSFDANSPPQTMEHVLVFPASSPESLT